MQLRRVREGSQLEEDHMRNRQLIVGWLRRHTTAIEVRRREGKTYFTMVDADAFHAGVGTPARRGAANQERGRLRGGAPADRGIRRATSIPSLRDEVVERVDRLRLPSYSAFVMPRLEPRRGPDGGIVDVDVSYPCDLEAQMLEYSAHARA